MPVNRKFDFYLDGKGYMLARPQNGQARSWQRSGVSDTPSVEQPRVAGEFGGLPTQIDYPEIWNDWSGGFGYAYRRPVDENSYFGFLANPNTYHWSENFDARFERQLVHSQKPYALEGSLDASFSFNVFKPDIRLNAEDIIDVPLPSFTAPGAGEGAVFITGHGNTTKWTPTGLTTLGSQFDTRVLDIGGDLLRSYGRRAALYGSYVYVGELRVAAGFAAIAIPDTSYTVSSLPAFAFTVAGNRLWRAFGDEAGHGFYLQNAAVVAPGDVIATGNWSATLSIGTRFQPIQDMLAYEDQVYLGCPDGLYAGDASGTFVNVLSELAKSPSNDNCRVLTTYNGHIIAPHLGGVYAYTPSATSARAAEVGPVIRSNKSPIQGFIRCAYGYGQWLLAGLYTGSYSYILSGREEQNGTFVWHPLNKLPAVTKIHKVHVDSITTTSGGQQISPRIWALTGATIPTGGTTSTYWWPIPPMYGNSLVNSFGFTGNYANSARMDLGSTDGRAPSTFKTYRSCEVVAENLDGSQRWGLIYYTIDQGTRTLLGTINTSPRSILFFPHNDGSFVLGQNIELSLESYIASGAEATTPVYRSIVLRQTQVPRSVDVITAIADIGDNVSDREGVRMRPGANQLQELRGLAATGPVRLKDLVGAESLVKVQVPIGEQESWQDGTGNPSVLATIKMSVMAFSGS